jgi:pyridine nucleotide-disulfide oxidoreductase family protein
MKRLVLIGAGHAHAQVLLDFARNRPADLDIVLITPFAKAPYSAMIPGWIAGHYEWDACCIDFEHLCQLACATMHLTEVASLEADGQRIILMNGKEVFYDWLSINIGSTLRLRSDESVPLLSIRPLNPLLTIWPNLKDHLRTQPANQPFRIRMVGGGSTGLEILLSACHTLSKAMPKLPIEWSLVTRGSEILPRMPASAIRSAKRHLAKHRVELHTNFPAIEIAEQHLLSSDGQSLPSNAVFWATNGQAHAWPRKSGLAVDEHGFIRIDARLHSLSHPNVFAVGDCASWGSGLPKAGVFAVNMGSVLSFNLQATPSNGLLQDYRPHRHYLSLIGTGENTAIANWGSFSWESAWVWHLKQRIDKQFLAQFNQATE